MTAGSIFATRTFFPHTRFSPTQKIKTADKLKTVNDQIEQSQKEQKQLQKTEKQNAKEKKEMQKADKDKLTDYRKRNATYYGAKY